MRVLRWLWASYEALTLWQWLVGLSSGGGIGGLAVLNFASEWELWQQALLAAGVAFLWLSVISWLLRFFRRPPTAASSQSQVRSPKAQQAGRAGGDIIQVGGDLSIGVSRQPNQGEAIRVPRLELSDPIRVAGQSECVPHDGKPWHIQVDLYRVGLKNTQPNSQAQKVGVKITKSKPYLSMLPVTLHRKNDNPPEGEPYEQSWTLRYDEPIEFDVIGYHRLASVRGGGSIGNLYVYRSDSGRRTIPFEVPGRETAQAMTGDGIVLTIAAFADLPTRTVKREYRAFMSSEDSFVLKPTVKQVPRKEDSAIPNTLKFPQPPELHVSYQKHEFGVFDGEPIVTVYAEYRPTGTMRIEAIELRLIGRSEPSLDWEVYEVKRDVWIAPGNRFRVPDGIAPGEHGVTLAAFANGEWWGSPPFPIVFPEVSS